MNVAEGLQAVIHHLPPRPKPYPAHNPPRKISGHLVIERLNHPIPICAVDGLIGPASLAKGVQARGGECAPVCGHIGAVDHIKPSLMQGRVVCIEIHERVGKQVSLKIAQFVFIRRRDQKQIFGKECTAGVQGLMDFYPNIARDPGYETKPAN